MDFKKTGIIKFLSSVTEKLKGKWLYAICSSLIFAFLVFLLTDLINLFAFLSVPLLGFVILGQISFMRKLLNGAKFNLEDLFNDYKLFIPAALTMALLTIMVSVGFVLLIIPGVILLARYTFALHCLEENKELGSLEALEASRALAKGYKPKIFAFYLVFLILSVLLFAVGLVISLPLNLIWGLNLITYAGLFSGVLATVFLHPLFIASLTALYDELKADKLRKDSEPEEVEEVEEVEAEEIEED